jgi:hypothetical protein
VPLWTANRVRLIDNQRLVDQLCGLRRKVGSAGREQVTHMAGAHDDIATAVCLPLSKLTPTRQAIIAGPIIFKSSGTDPLMPAGGSAWDEYDRIVGGTR